jgi:peroxiredoxin
MKTPVIRLLLLLFAAFASLPGQAQSDETDLVRVGDPMPSFTVLSDSGAQIIASSDECKGKVTLILFFATWCPPCQAELAEIKKTLWPTYKDRDDFVLLVIGREHSEAELAIYNAKKGFTFPLYPDKDRKIYAAFATQLIPRTYLIDPSGKVIYVAKGFEPKDFERLQRIIANTLSQKLESHNP